VSELRVGLEGYTPGSAPGVVSSSLSVTNTTGGTAGTATFVKITDGTATASVAVPGTGGSSLLVATGTTAAVTSLTTATTGNGTAYDFGSARANISAAVLVNGTVTAGTVRLEGSHDNSNWIPLTTSATLATGVNQDVSKSGVAYRFARAVVGTTVTGGGSVTVTVAAA